MLMPSEMSDGTSSILRPTEASNSGNLYGLGLVMLSPRAWLCGMKLKTNRKSDLEMITLDCETVETALSSISTIYGLTKVIISRSLFLFVFNFMPHNQARGDNITRPKPYRLPLFDASVGLKIELVP